MMAETTTRPTTNVLELRKVGRRFGSDPAVDALVEVDLRLEPGEWLAITGPSGAGKSTLIKVITGFYKRDEGDWIIRRRWRETKTNC